MLIHLTLIFVICISFSDASSTTSKPAFTTPETLAERANDLVERMQKYTATRNIDDQMQDSDDVGSDSQTISSNFDLDKIQQATMMRVLNDHLLSAQLGNSKRVRLRSPLIIETTRDNTSTVPKLILKLPSALKQKDTTLEQEQTDEQGVDDGRGIHSKLSLIHTHGIQSGNTNSVANIPLIFKLPLALKRKHSITTREPEQGTDSQERQEGEHFGGELEPKLQRKNAFRFRQRIKHQR